ncbi:ribosome recycling factor [Sphaerobacter thermophilus]|uniref:Ribosome-recycling factor n=1 Tax=Sphaerobacter thermophilus (strain ATCC 49802 / DSM 20745 / KCCM 41009 / NCIMB 13125 / S 6022) TaxID=479434 RepID=D1C4K4_SPHTD|nr:ribosome recycling factor [Sphaerobacter thermophilus]ACZ39171.1 ribosome recycling factor [Sphaerobacter thermophilus DSM 20745]PZN64616.1 MAG: ribosome recycling factor [Sphaerobacter thermophilus]
MIEDVLADAEGRMTKTLDNLQRELAGIRTGRASPGLIERLEVDYYGTPTPLNQVAGISAPEPRLLVVQPWDRSAMSAIEKAIRSSDLGLNPTNDGQVIRIAIPPLTEERRKALVRVVRQKVEESRVAIRNIRRDALAQVKEMLQEKLIGEDDERRAEQQVQELTNRYINEADKIGKNKEAEVLEV